MAKQIIAVNLDDVLAASAKAFGDYKWGRNIGPLPPRVTRCIDWGEVEAYFDQRD